MRRVLFLILLLSSINVFSQSFTFVTESITRTDTLESEIIYDFQLTNTSQDTIIIYIKWGELEFPDEWEFSVCMGIICYAPFIDSIVTTEEYSSSPLAPGDVRDFSIHVIPKVTDGTGQIFVRAGNLADLNDTVSVVLTASTLPLSVRDISPVESFRLLQNYPNPFNPSTDIMFEVNERTNLSLELYSVTGEKIAALAEGEYMPGIYKYTFDASKFSSGLYIVKLSSDLKNSVIKIMLEK